jgi:hypothetical protein
LFCPIKATTGTTVATCNIELQVEAMIVQAQPATSVMSTVFGSWACKSVTPLSCEMLLTLPETDGRYVVKLLPDSIAGLTCTPSGVVAPVVTQVSLPHLLRLSSDNTACNLCRLRTLTLPHLARASIRRFYSSLHYSTVCMFLSSNLHRHFIRSKLLCFMCFVAY